MADLNSRVQAAVSAMMERVDKLGVRPLQKRIAACVLECYSSDTASSSAVQACVNRCQGPSEAANSIVQQEMGGFQARLQRCAADCSDKARDALPSSPSKADISKAQAAAESCTASCLDSHLPALGKVESRLLEQLTKL